jgi:hypothetical protein
MREGRLGRGLVCALLVISWFYLWGWKLRAEGEGRERKVRKANRAGREESAEQEKG